MSYTLRFSWLLFIVVVACFRAYPRSFSFSSSVDVSRCSGYGSLWKVGSQYTQESHLVWLSTPYPNVPLLPHNPCLLEAHFVSSLYLCQVWETSPCKIVLSLPFKQNKPILQNKLHGEDCQTIQLRIKRMKEGSSKRILQVCRKTLTLGGSAIQIHHQHILVMQLWV